MDINHAIQFVVDEVESPALEHPLLEKEFKNKVTRSKIVVHRMKKIGDLARYLQRFETVPPPSDPKRKLYDRFKSLGLKTYEDLYPEFVKVFAHGLDDVTVLDDFIIGKDYSSWDISIFSQTYDTQSGIYLIGDEPNYLAIFIKATFSDGKYPNEWIQKYDVLKYYMYSLNNVFKSDYKYNAAIINSPKYDVPIYVFEKQAEKCLLKGIYKYERDEGNPVDGSKWFILNKVNSFDTKKAVTHREYEQEVSKQVTISKTRNRAERRERLQTAPKAPGTVTVTSTQFVRNGDVIVEVLERARGICEECKKPAPFLRKDLTPFLEVHHVEPLSEGGEDTVENAKALCPNCHRAAHHAADVVTVTAAIIMDEGKVLIAKRASDGITPGLWEFPGGKVEGQESLEQCLRREIKEELGATIRVQKYFGESIFQNSKAIYRIMAFYAKILKGDIQSNIHDELKWVDISELSQYSFLPADITFVEELQRRASKWKK
ncbi:NUDIX domain-containing protein [Paenibacillus pinisoli]|uniref:8-oxo-dGTP diphosphatase n=1 Tax=Paenibacillus pinisoli TaxID=1276110 RepID=A0A3A6PNC9_9BACL|nr:NUDIX domain-containing protein [Paenibacillus pinisoli]RJX40888.1 NUDIX domain-containing protein [Paenibacillus pinisoli]